jgi:TonB-linked SusC/RagA family outer membrane protein
LFETFDSQYDYNFSFNRYNYRTNLDVDLTRTTKLGITLGGRVGVRNQPNSNMNNFFRNISWAVPFSGPGIVDNRYILSSDYYIPGPKKDGLTEFYGRGYQNQTRNDLNLDIDLRQKLDVITQGLIFRTKFAYNNFYTHTKTRGSSVPKFEPFYQRDLDPTVDSTDQTIVYRQSGSYGNLSYNESAGKGRNNYLEFGFDYSRRFGNHNVTGLLLYNQQKVYYPSNPQEFSYIPTGLVGLVGRVTYNFKTKYLVDLNIGYNGSENFSEELRFGFFPAGSLGWIVTEESFMPEISFLDYLKLRASVGLVGNDKLGGARFLYLPDSYESDTWGYNFGTNVPQDQRGAAEGRVGNPSVTWETALKQNYGFDLRLFEGRLGFHYDYFMEHRRDILTVRQTVPDYIAIELPAVNIGEVDNRGYEIELRWRQNLSGKFNYWVNANMSHARNNIEFMDEVPQPEGYEYLYRTGQPVGQFFGYVFDGFYTDDRASEIPDHQYALQPGDMTYKDIDGNGVINQLDQRAIGFTIYPQYIYGLNFGLNYRGFDLAVYTVAATHTSRLLDEQYRKAFGATLDRSLMQYMADGRWTPETAATATYPRMTLTGSLNNSKDSDFWLRDASYFRVKNIELGYNFKGEALNRVGVKMMRVYLNGFNVITFSRLEIADPESRPGRNPEYPLIKIYNAGLKLNF